MSATSISNPSERERGSGPEPSPLAPALARPSRRQRTLAAAVLVAVLVALCWWVANSALFRMQRLQVRGVSQVSRAEIERVGGLSARTDVLRVSTASIAHRLEAIPWVRSARVSRSLPSTILITIVERVPVGVVSSQGSSFLVSGDGVILAPATDGSKLTAIDLSSPPGPLSPGTRLSPVPPTLTALAALSAQIRRLVLTAGVDVEGSVELILRGGTHVRFGDGSQAAGKARVLASVLRWAEHHSVRPAYVDVRAPDAPALLPVGAATPWALPSA